MADDTPRAKVACDGCGQVDDHPMIHIGPYAWQKDERITVTDPSFHFDCIPPALVEEFGLVVEAPQHAVTVAAMEAARSGVHGAKLQAFIDKQETDNEVPDEVVYAASTGSEWTGPGVAPGQEG